VCLHGTGQFTSIREAIKHATPGARIEVRPGLYREALVIDKPLQLIGTGPADQVIVESDDNTCLKMHTLHATVQGLVLRGGSQVGKTRHHVVDIPKGRLVLEDCRILSGALSCVAVHGASAHPVLRRCTIRHGKESGVLLFGSSQCLLEDCDINGNAVGISIRHYACPTIRRCRIYDSVSHGIHSEDYAEGSVEDSEIVDNGHAGVCIDYGSMLVVQRCRVSRNARAIAVASDGGGQIRGCDLSGNTFGAWSILPGAESWLRRVGNRE
jgi:parallel beta-helix repeat protein